MEHAPGAYAHEVLASIGYAADMTVSDCRYHSWRMALVAERLAEAMDPSIRQDVFFGALIQDTGAVGSCVHVLESGCGGRRSGDQAIANHAQTSSVLLSQLPGLSRAGQFVRLHHTWFGGRRSHDADPSARMLGAQILAVVDMASRAGSLSSYEGLSSGLNAIRSYTGRGWTAEVWSALAESAGDTTFAEVLVNPAALPHAIADTMSRIGIPEELRSAKATELALLVFSALVDLKDRNLRGHSLRTARYARLLARRLGMREPEARIAYRAGLVHDCGKMGLPESVVGIARRLTPPETALMREHAAMTIRALSCIPGSGELRELARIAGHSHERYDGGGFPDGLAGEEIPLLSRVLSVADEFDAITAPSSYRIMTQRAAILQLTRNSGSQFDPRVVSAMESVLRQDIVELRRISPSRSAAWY